MCSRRAMKRFNLLCVLVTLSVGAVMVSFFMMKLVDPTPCTDLTLPHPSRASVSSPSKGMAFQCGNDTFMTIEQCQHRLKEFVQQISAETQIRLEFFEKAQERAERNEYSRQRPNQWKSRLHEQFQMVSNLVGAPPTPWANLTNASFPDISIMGFPKAGTSQLYKLLVSHSDALPIFKRKEFCMDHGHFMDYTRWEHQNNESLRALQKKLFIYHRHVLNKRANASQSMLVNACLQMEELPYHIAYAKLPESSKFLMLFRDPADWLWASWNFWVDKNLDVNKPVDHDWATMGVHYRSPELFHELVLSQGTTKSAGMRFRKMREQTVHNPRHLLHLIDDTSRVMFVKSEDMKNNAEGFLTRLSQFTGLSEHKFDNIIAHSLTNCNARKGYQTSCNATTSSSAYAITRDRPMLEVTRQLIYIQFLEECKVWAEEFGIIYRDCLRSVPRQP